MTPTADTGFHHEGASKRERAVQAVQHALEVPAAQLGRRRGRFLLTGLAMSAGCLASVIAASALHRGSPWTGLNAITAGLGLASRRPSDRFDPQRALVGLGAILVGSIVVAAMQDRLATGLGKGRFGRGALAGLGIWAVDRYALRGEMMPALERSMGRSARSRSTARSASLRHWSSAREDGAAPPRGARDDALGGARAQRRSPRRCCSTLRPANTAVSARSTRAPSARRTAPAASSRARSASDQPPSGPTART